MKRETRNLKLEIGILVLVFVNINTLYAQGTGIRDNSFLIEEGYNQEHGVVQHILTHRTDWIASGPSEATTDFAFTQEWPLWGQKIQGSYTLPIATQFEGADVHLRYQLMQEPDDKYSIAPRLSFLLAYETDLELANMLGYQINVPISKELDAKRMVHANLGATFMPPQIGSVSLDNDSLWTYHAGVSGIYAWSQNFHLMAEFLNWVQEHEPPLFAANPGARYAVNLTGRVQWVFGASAPLLFRSRLESYGLFLYMSLEHDFMR